MNIESKHVVVTGAGSGVGAELAALFASEGCKVTILGRRIKPLEDVAHRISALPLVADVTDRSSIDAALKTARAKHGPVDIAIANAGAVHSAPFAKTSIENFRATLGVNLEGVFNLWQATLGDMKDASWGRMIAIASTAGLKGYSYVAPYCASKHGVVGLTRALAQELAQTGITVNAICPGFIETSLLERSIKEITQKTGLSDTDARKSLVKTNPQGRFVQMSEVASSALWLCSNGAASVNGHALSLSGGEI